MTTAVTVTYSGDEAGTITDGSDTLSFSEIERVELSDFAEVVDASLASSAQFVDAMGGDDAVTGTSGGDIVSAGSGADTVDGGAGDDIVVGDQDSLTFNATGTDGLALASGVADFPTNALSFEITYSTTSTGSDNTFVSYATSGEANEFLVYSSASDTIQVAIAGSALDTGLNVSSYADGNPHTLGVTWDSSSGALEVYVDGANLYSGTHQTGATLTQGGTLTFGQEQDSVGGGFDTNQIFEGDFHGASLYGDVRTQTEIEGSAGQTVASNFDDANLVSNWVPDGNTDTLTDLTGNHTMTLSGDVAPTEGTAAADDLGGGDGSDILFGGAGDDTISGGAGDDCLEGGEGADLMMSGTGDDTVFGGGRQRHDQEFRG